LGMFFVPKVNTTTALIVETHTIAYNEYIEANAGIIAGDGFLWFYYTQNNSDIELEVWLMNNAEYNNFVQYGSGLHYTIYTGSGNFSEWVGLGYTDLLHILIFNVDVPQRTTEIKLHLDKDQIMPHDGGTDDEDAGGTFAGAMYLEEEDYNSTGRLFFGDIADFYKFYANQSDHLTLNIRGLRFGNTSFTLYAPGGFTEVATADYITQDIEFTILINYTGYWIMRFYKDADDLLLSKYNFEIQISLPTVLISTPISIPIVTVITISLPVVCAMVILTKKRKQ
ncbi:MAG: hypothetical protein ACTSVP_10720, partial [Candidatus Heimdallarchaeota archaeon]